MTTSTRHPHILDWDDGRKFGDPIMVTLIPGFAFDSNDTDAASHVCGFTGIKDAVSAAARAQPCACSRCKPTTITTAQETTVTTTTDRTGFDEAIRNAETPDHRNFSKPLAKRIKLERQVATALVREGLKHGLTVSVHDSEEWALKGSTSEREIMLALFSTDSDTVRFRDAAGNRAGDFVLIYGNDGYDVISDYTITDTSEAIYGALRPLLDRLENQA